MVGEISQNKYYYLSLQDFSLIRKMLKADSHQITIKFYLLTS
jgi:hypothetical protein